ncbi:MAG: hypothetical protein AAGE96_03125 [Cyanobacteria bacterium P01_G01_bin.19]
MNNRLSHPPKIERHLKLWIYLLPVFGVFPSIWTLYRSPENGLTNLPEDRERKKASQLSLKLALAWLISYSSLSLGAASASGLLSFRLLYANAIVTTIYFITCTILMTRLGRKSSE